MANFSRAVIEMNKYRSRLQIIADILNVAGGTAKKTQIMYQANLSYKLLCQYLTDVVEAGLVSNSGNHYMLTEKGKAFLEKYRKYHKRCKQLEKQFNTVENEKSVLEQMCSRVSTIGDS